MVQDNPDILFVFGDNMIEQGYGGQAKSMRGEPNAVGIPTKNFPDTTPKSYFSDKDYREAELKITLRFLRLIEHARKGEKIVWPFDGIGTGLADLKNKSPKIWNLIEDNRKSLEKMMRE
jgi:hypothetical protein